MDFDKSFPDICTCLRTYKEGLDDYNFNTAMKSKVQNFVMGGQWHHNPTALVDRLMANQESLLDIVTPEEFNKIVSIVLNTTVLPFPSATPFRGGGRPPNMNFPLYPGYGTSPSVVGPHIAPSDFAPGGSLSGQC
jgi:hypothetical protein